MIDDEQLVSQPLGSRAFAAEAGRVVPFGSYGLLCLQSMNHFLSFCLRYGMIPSIQFLLSNEMDSNCSR